MNEPARFRIESEATAKMLALYPAVMVLLSTLLIDWRERNNMHTISGMLLVAGAYSAFRAFRMRHRTFEKVPDTKAIGYWIYGTSVALVALLASTPFRSALLLVLMTAFVMFTVISKHRFPVVTRNNLPPGE